FILQHSLAHRHLHSFPTRRSSDLVVKVENFLKATSLMSQTTLRSVLGQAPLDDLLSQRESIYLKLQEIIDRQTEPWGVKVTAVRSEEHTSELQSPYDLVCRLLLEK